LKSLECGKEVVITHLPYLHEDKNLLGKRKRGRGGEKGDHFRKRKVRREPKGEDAGEKQAEQIKEKKVAI